MSNNTSLAKALANAQGQMSAADKNAKGNFGKYATLAAIWDAIRDPLSKNGLSVAQTFEYNDERIVMLRTTLMHESGESLESLYPVLPVKADPQGYGSAITYARRYTLAAMVGIAPDDDDDGEGAGKAREHARQQAQQTQQAQQAQRPQPQTNSSGNGSARPAGALEDDEQAIFDAQPKEFFDLVASFIPRYRNEPGKAMGAVEKITGKRSIPAKPMERVELFRSLKDHAKWRDAQDAPADLLAAVAENANSAHTLNKGAYA